MKRTTRSLKAAPVLAAALILGGIVGGVLGRLTDIRTADVTPSPPATASPGATLLALPTGLQIARPTPILRSTRLPVATAAPVAAPTAATPVEPAPFELGAPVAASIEEEGIGISLALDTDRLSFGQLVWANVTIANLGADNVYWGHSSTCDFAAGVAARPPALEELPVGREDWPGDKGILKMISLHPQSPEPQFIPESRLGSATPFACTTDFVTSELPPGGQLHHRAAWYGAGPYGMPARPGTYMATAAFHYLGRGFAPPRNDMPPSGIAIRVDVPLTVIGPDADYLAPGEAFDRVLADWRFDTAMSRAPRERWLGSNVAFEDGAWVMRLRLERPSEALVATVDAISGHVLSVEFLPG